MIGRVFEEHKTNYIILSERKEYTGVVRGSFHESGTKEGFPKVGDLVECTESSEGQVVIERVLPRTSEIVRKGVASNERQVMVANVEVIFIILGLDADFNLRRLERYLLLAQQSGVAPVVILNKADVVADPDEYVRKVKEVSPDTPVYAISAAAGIGLSAFARHMKGETIAVLLGSSGAGKSTIMNALLKENRQSTNAVRGDDSRGRHTTTARHMFTLPGLGYLIDTPGMRELGVLSSDDDAADVFADIEKLKLACVYSDCDHLKSDGCAIQEAIANGELDKKRLENYLKLLRERAYSENKKEGLAHEHKQRIRKLHTDYIKIQRQKAKEREER